MDEQVPPHTKHKLLKWIFGVLVFIILLLATSAWYINNRWKPILANTLKNTLIEASDSLYRVDFSNININIVTGAVSFDNIEITPNLRIYQKLIHQRIAPENIFNLKITKLSIQHVSPLKVYKYRKLDIKTLSIEKPSLTVFYTKLRNTKIKDEDLRTAYERIKNILNEVKIGSLFFLDVKLRYVDHSFKPAKTTYIDKVNLRLNNILINSTSVFDNSRIFTAKDVIAEMSDYTFATPDSMYHLSLKHVAVSTQKKQLIVEGICLIPRYREMTFSNQFEHEQERYKIMFDSLIANNIDFNALLRERTFSATSVKIMNGELDVFLNREKAKRAINKGPNFPNLALQRVAWGIIADTVLLKNINVSYTEYNPKTKGRGTVFFNDLDGRIFNVTNDSLALIKNNYSDAYVEAYLMGKGKLNIHIGFNLTNPKGAFTYKGSLGSMQASTINALTKPLAMIMTNSGDIQSLSFDMKGNMDGAGGTLTLKYNNLNVILMKKDEEENFKKMGLMSLFANAILLERDNPTRNKPIRVAHPYYNRPKDASFFNLMWKAVFVGLKESVGITQEKEAKILQRVANFKEAKVKRGQRKIERQQRRADRKNK